MQSRYFFARQTCSFYFKAFKQYFKLCYNLSRFFHVFQNLSRVIFVYGAPKKSNLKASLSKFFEKNDIKYYEFAKKVFDLNFSFANVATK